MPAATLPSLDEIPIYREGVTDEDSMSQAENDPVGFHLRAFRKLGPIYRIKVKNRLALMLAGLDSNDFIWRNTDLWTYQQVSGAFREQLGDDHVTSIDGEHHRQKRTILKPAFDQGPAMRYLPQYNALFHEEMKVAAGRQRVDLVHFWAKAICRAQSRTVAQTELEEDALERLVAWEKLLLGGIRLGDDRFAYYADPTYLDLKSAALKLMGDMVDERLAHPGKYNDNFALVMQARAEEGAPMDRDKLIDDLYFVLVAGVENTSKLLNAALLSTIRDPHWLAELRIELDAWDGQDVMALSQMTKLKATIMEAQRLHPPTFFNGRQATRDFEYGGYLIPAGTFLTHVQVLCHYLDEIYPDPLSFHPQRFVEDGRFVAKTIGIFGGGVHICLGRNHTLLQSPIAMAQMLKYYDIEPVEVVSSAGKDLPPGFFLIELWARVSPRRA